MSDFTIPELNDLRARYLSGESPTDDEYRKVLEHLRAHRQATLARAEARQRAKYTNVTNVFGENQ